MATLEVDDAEAPRTEGDPARADPCTPLRHRVRGGPARIHRPDRILRRGRCVEPHIPHMRCYQVRRDRSAPAGLADVGSRPSTGSTAMHRRTSVARGRSAVGEPIAESAAREPQDREPSAQSLLWTPRCRQRACRPIRRAEPPRRPAISGSRRLMRAIPSNREFDVEPVDDEQSRDPQFTDQEARLRLAVAA